MSDSPTISRERLPAHVAIIMDGNGRWATQRKQFRTMGHKVGVESVQNIVRAAREIGIKALTLYAFSTENWQRPPVEVKALMGLLKSYLQKELDNMLKNNIKLMTIGQRHRLPADVQDILAASIDKTSANTGMVLNLALSYGSRDEITTAVREIARKCADGTLAPDEITEELISGHLQTASLPDPDLIIRTSGESRLSNFLMWQAAYSEIYITETHWPDFRKPDFVKALEIYAQRERRFGKTGDQIRKGKP